MNRHPRLQMALGMCIILGQIAATETEAASAEYADVMIAGVPHVQQKPDFCGEACVEMYLRKLGRTMDQDFVFDQSGLDPAIGRGCYTRELVKAISAIGFRVGDAFFTVSKKHVRTTLPRLGARRRVSRCSTRATRVPRSTGAREPRTPHTCRDGLWPAQNGPAKVERAQAC